MKTNSAESSASETTPVENVRIGLKEMAVFAGLLACALAVRKDSTLGHSDAELTPSTHSAFLDGETGESTTNLLRLEKASIDSQNAPLSQMEPFLDR